MPSTMQKMVRKTKDACGIYNEATCKANCKMGSTRVKMMLNKENANRVRLENEVAECIRNMKLEKARVKAEQVLNCERTEMGYDVLETMLELLHSRAALIGASDHMPEDLRVCVATIMHCADRVAVDELHVVADQLKRKWGDHFAENQLSPNGEDCHPKIVDCLSIFPPSENTIESCISAICEKRGIPYLSAAGAPQHDDDDLKDDNADNKDKSLQMF